MTEATQTLAELNTRAIGRPSTSDIRMPIGQIVHVQPRDVDNDSTFYGFPSQSRPCSEHACLRVRRKLHVVQSGIEERALRQLHSRSIALRMPSGIAKCAGEEGPIGGRSSGGYLIPRVSGRGRTRICVSVRIAKLPAQSASLSNILRILCRTIPGFPA